MPTVDQIKERLTEAGVDFPASATKPKLEAIAEENGVSLSQEEDVTTPESEDEETSAAESEETVVEETPEEESDGELTEYEGSPVIKVTNQILNGRMYKEVRTVTATYTLTKEEYAEALK